MPWAAGVYTRGYPSWSADAASNLPISATKFDTEDNDFATGLNNCLTKDGLSAPNAPMTWALSNGQILQLNRGSDGNVLGLGRTGGSNNPSFKFAVADTGGLSLSGSYGSFSVVGSAGYTPLLLTTGAITDNALTLNSIAGGLSAAAFEVNGTIKAYVGVAGASAQISANAAAGDLVLRANGGSLRINTASGTGSDAILVQTQGNVTIAQPSSGTSLTVNPQTTNGTVAVAAAGLTLSYGNYLLSNTAEVSSSAPLTLGTHAAQPLYLYTNTLPRLQVNAAGNVTINAPDSGISLVVTQLAGAANPAATFQGVSTAGSSAGVFIQAGNANASDRVLDVLNYNATVRYLGIFGDGGVIIGAPTGGDKGSGTLNIATGLYVAGNPIYAGAPTNQKSANYTAVLSDANTALTSGGSTPFTFTIPANASVAYPNGTMLTFVNFPGGPATVNIAINSDTLYLSPTGATGTRTLAANGIATALKLDVTHWIISGTGLT